MKKLLIVFLLITTTSSFAIDLVNINFNLHIQSQLANGRSMLNGYNPSSLNIQKMVIKKLSEKGYIVASWQANKNLLLPFKAQSFQKENADFDMNINCSADALVDIGGNGQVSTGLILFPKSIATLTIAEKNIHVKSSKKFNRNNTSCYLAIEDALNKL